MKKIVSLLILSLNVLASPVAADIIETPHFKDLINHVDEDTLVLLDIDDTMLIPSQTLGTDVWFIHRMGIYQKEHEFMVALDKAIAEWEAVRHVTKVNVVEEGTAEIIKEIQGRNIKVMGFTTQGVALATRTVKQLKSLNIYLANNAPSSDDLYMMNGHGILFRKGILFTAGSSKGAAIVKYLETINYKPKKIVFINDKSTHLKDLETGCKKLGIEFTGLRYSYSDARVASFRPEIADIQWKYSTFDHILSDEEAESYLEYRIQI